MKQINIFKWNITWLKFQLEGGEPAGYFYQRRQGFEIRTYREQIQRTARAGHELRASRLQVLRHISLKIYFKLLDHAVSFSQNLL